MTLRLPLSRPVEKVLFEGDVSGEAESFSGADENIFLQYQFKNAPRKGLDMLFRKYYAPLCSHAVRFVYSRPIAEDLVSEVFYQFYKTRAYENIGGSYAGYLFRAVRNEAYTWLKREFGKFDPLEAAADPVSDMLRPDLEIHYNQLFRKIDDIVSELPPQCRKVFLMSRFENRKYHEIAEELNISHKTVEVHISKALRCLRQALRDEWLLLLLFLII